MSTTPTLPVEPSPIYRDVELKGPDVLVDDRVQQREVWPDTAKVEEYAALYHEGRDLGRLVFFHDAAEQVLVLAVLPPSDERNSTPSSTIIVAARSDVAARIATETSLPLVALVRSPP